MLILFAGSSAFADNNGNDRIDQQLRAELRRWGGAGRIESMLTTRLGRPINTKLFDLGRLLWFDNSGGLHNDKHLRRVSFAVGGTRRHSVDRDRRPEQPIGCRSRLGPRNQRRTPTAVNTVFYSALMWTDRFSFAVRRPVQNLWRIHRRQKALLPFPQTTR